MKVRIMRYAVIIEQGEPREEAVELIQEAIGFHLEGMKAEALTIPQPLSTSELVEVGAREESEADFGGCKESDEESFEINFPASDRVSIHWRFRYFSADSHRHCSALSMARCSTPEELLF